MQIKKVVIPAAGLGTRFLPLTKVLAKELLPLVDSPMIDYVCREAKDSEIKNIIFVLAEQKKNVLEYFTRKPKLETLLKKRNKKDLLERLRKADQDFEGISFSSAQQQTPKGDGDAVLKAKRQVGKDAFGVLFPDDIFESKIPALNQLKKVFTTSQKAIIGLKQVPKEQLPSYGVVKVEKIANRLYKVKEIIEKPEIAEAPSDLAIAGRYVFPPEIFKYLDKTLPNKKGEIILAEALRLMLKDGKMVYGVEIEGQWLECGKTVDWLKSHLQLCLKHPQYGPMLRDFLKKTNKKL